MARCDRDLTVEIPDCIDSSLYVSFKVKVALNVLTATSELSFLRKTF